MEPFDVVLINLFSDRQNRAITSGHMSPALLQPALSMPTTGVITVSGMLLIMRDFVRGNPDKKRKVDRRPETRLLPS